MILNPFFILSLIYLTSSFFVFYTGINDGGFLLVNSFYEISIYSYVIAFSLQIFFLFVLFFAYKLLLKKNISHKNIMFNDRWGWGVVFLQILYIIFIKQTGAGIAGSNYSFGGFNIFNYFFILFSPDVLGFIIIPFLKNVRLFWLAALLISLSFLIRGWMGSVLFLFVIVLIRFYPVKLKIGTLFICSFLLCFLFISLPMLDALKWGLRLGLSLSDIVETGTSNYSLGVLVDNFTYILYRFTHINYLAFVVENSFINKDVIDLSGFRNFWMNGIIYETIVRIFDSQQMDLNTYLVSEFFDPSGKKWNVDSGILSWIFVSGYSFPFLIIYLGILFYLPYRFIFKYFGVRSYVLVFCFILVYLYNGWISSYFNFLLYLIMFSFFYRLRFRQRSTE